MFMHKWFFTFWVCLVQEKNKIWGFWLLLWKHLLILKIVPKAKLIFCSGFHSILLVDFFQCTFTAGCRNNFQDYRQVSEKLLETQAAIRRPETSSLKRVTATGRNFTTSDFIEASRNFILDFLHINAIQIVLIQKDSYKPIFYYS